MEKDDKGSMMIRMGVSGWMFLLVPAYPGCPRSKDVKWSLLLLLLHQRVWEEDETVYSSTSVLLSLRLEYTHISRNIHYFHAVFVVCIQVSVKSNAVASLKTIFTQEIFTEQVGTADCSVARSSTCLYAEWMTTHTGSWHKRIVRRVVIITVAQHITCQLCVWSWICCEWVCGFLWRIITKNPSCASIAWTSAFYVHCVPKKSTFLFLESLCQ